MQFPCIIASITATFFATTLRHHPPVFHPIVPPPPPQNSPSSCGSSRPFSLQHPITSIPSAICPITVLAAVAQPSSVATICHSNVIILVSLQFMTA